MPSSQLSLRARMNEAVTTWYGRGSPRESTETPEQLWFSWRMHVDPEQRRKIMNRRIQAIAMTGMIMAAIVGFGTSCKLGPDNLSGASQVQSEVSRDDSEQSDRSIRRPADESQGPISTPDQTVSTRIQPTAEEEELLDLPFTAPIAERQDSTSTADQISSPGAIYSAEEEELLDLPFAAPVGERQDTTPTADQIFSPGAIYSAEEEELLDLPFTAPVGER